jgi:hypothetical protein
MTTIREHAEPADGPEIVLMSDLPQRGQAQVKHADLVDCNELTEEDEFPEHGSFLEVENAQGETEYWECAGSLATEVVDGVDEMGDAVPGILLSVLSVAKAPSGEWRCSVELERSDE